MALPLLREGSAVVLNASNVSQMGWMPVDHLWMGGSVYAAAKAAVRSFARSWTLEVPPTKTRFNVVSPGAVETRQLDKLGRTQAEAQTLRQSICDAMLDKIPAKRFAKPEEIANVVLFLASPESASRRTSYTSRARRSSRTEGGRRCEGEEGSSWGRDGRRWGGDTPVLCAAQTAPAPVAVVDAALEMSRVEGRGSCSVRRAHSKRVSSSTSAHRTVPPPYVSTVSSPPLEVQVQRGR